MTEGRILLHGNLGEGHQKKYILQALKECLDEIEKLQAHKELMGHALKEVERASDAEVGYGYRKLARKTLEGVGL